MDKVRLFTHNFISASLIQLCTSNCFYVLMAVIPVYAATELGLSKSKIGLISGAFSLTCVSIRPFAGALIDSFGRLKTYRPALLLFSISIASHIFSAGFFSILISRVFQGAAWGFIGTAGPTIAADIIPQKRRAEGLAYYYLFMSIGMASGPALGIFLLDIMPFKAVFALFAGVAFLACGCTYSVKLPYLPIKKLSVKTVGLFETRVLSIAVLLAFYGMVYGGLLTFVVLHGKQEGIENAGLFYLFFAVTMAATRPIGGKLLDRSGPGHIIGFGLLMMITGFIVLAASAHNVTFYSSAVVLGVGSGTVLPPLAAMTINVVPAHRRGAANATAFTALDIGTGAGAMLLGVIADVSSIRCMFTISAIILIFPLIYYYLTFRQKYNLLINNQNLFNQ